MIQEQQVKIGYMSGVTRFYYPLQSLNRLLGTELTEEEMQHAMEKFSDHACDRLGKVTASSKNGRFCITLPPQASDYVHENRKPSEFLVRFIGTVARHGCTLDEVMDVFHAYSEHVPVSYTHLDVYKRQIILCPRSVFVTTGKTPSLMDRKYIRTMAAKKFGMELPIKLKNIIR